MEAEGFLQGIARGVLEGLEAVPSEQPPGIGVRVVASEIDPVTSTEDVSALRLKKRRLDLSLACRHIASGCDKPLPLDGPR